MKSNQREGAMKLKTWQEVQEFRAEEPPEGLGKKSRRNWRQRRRKSELGQLAAAIEELQRTRMCNRPRMRNGWPLMPLEWRLRQWRRDAEAHRAGAVRADLLRSARVARSLGFSVRSSTDRTGRVSSYYVTPPDDVTTCRRPRAWRISDHDVPETGARAYQAEVQGGHFDGGADVYASASPVRRSLWWKRAFSLLAAGRLVPGT